MNLRQIIPTDMTASAIAHLSLLALVLLFSEVHPFGSVTAEPIAVDIVTPQEIDAETKPEAGPTPTPQPDFSALDETCADSAARPPLRLSNRLAARPQQAGGAWRAPRPAAASRRPPVRRNRSRRRRRRPTRRPSPICRSNITCCSACRRISPPAPPPAPARQDKTGDNFDAPANKAADVASSVVAEFRRHLQDLLETAGLADGLRRRQGQAARVHDAGRQACRRADPDRGQRVA